MHYDDGLRDLCLGLHTNPAPLSVPSPSWYPDTREKLGRMLALTDLARADQSVGDKLRSLDKLISGRGDSPALQDDAGHARLRRRDLLLPHARLDCGARRLAGLRPRQ